MKFSHRLGLLMVLTLLHFSSVFDVFGANPSTNQTHQIMPALVVSNSPSLKHRSDQTDFLVVFVVTSAWIIVWGLLVKGGRGHASGACYRGGSGGGATTPGYGWRGMP